MAYSCPPVSKEALTRLMRQTERWLIAARQDLNPGVKFLHASYGVGNLDIIRQVIADDEIIKVTGKNPIRLLRELEALQDQAQSEIGF